MTRYFLSSRLRNPSFWMLLAGLSALSGWLLLIQVEQFIGAQARVAVASDTFGVTPMVLAPYLSNLKLLVLLALPLLLGPLLASNTHAHPLWLGSRLSSGALAGGILLYVWAIAALWVAVLMAGAAALGLGTTLDLQLTMSAWLGVGFLLLFFAQLHALIVCHARSSASALLASLSVNLSFVLIDLSASASGLALDHLSVLNPLAHYASFLQGRPTVAGLVLLLGSALSSYLLLQRRIERMRQGR